MDEVNRRKKIEDYKKRMFESAGVQPLTPKQKKELEKQRSELEKGRASLREQIRKLELKLKDSGQTLSVPGAQYIHDKCGIRAAIYYGTTPQGCLAGGDRMNYCLFCNSEYEAD